MALPELAPPVVAHLIYIRSRPHHGAHHITFQSQATDGTLGLGGIQHVYSEGLHGIANATMGEMMLKASCKRGPDSSPSSRPVAGIQTRCVPHVCPCAYKVLLQYGRRAHMRRTLGFIKSPARGETVAMSSEMVVTVNQPRQYRQARDIDVPVPVGVHLPRPLAAIRPASSIKTGHSAQVRSCPIDERRTG